MSPRIDLLVEIAAIWVTNVVGIQDRTPVIDSRGGRSSSSDGHTGEVIAMIIVVRIVVRMMVRVVVVVAIVVVVPRIIMIIQPVVVVRRQKHVSGCPWRLLVVFGHLVSSSCRQTTADEDNGFVQLDGVEC